MSAQGPAVSLRVYLGLSQGESRFVWHGILFEEPNPTGSRPSDLIGLYKQHVKLKQKAHHPNPQGRARRKDGGDLIKNS